MDLNIDQVKTLLLNAGYAESDTSSALQLTESFNAVISAKLHNPETNLWMSAWTQIFNLCVSLGMQLPYNETGLTDVLNFIRQKAEKAAVVEGPSV